MNKRNLENKTDVNKEKNKNALIQERIENGDIYFPFCKNKGKCKNCGAVIDKDNDKYCWRCGSKINESNLFFINK